MRKLVLAIALTLLCSALPRSGAAETSAAPSPSTADLAFLASLAGDPGQLPAPVQPAIGTPAPSPRSCSISRACGDGNTAACTGTFSCVYSQRGVTCDNGTEVACPNYCAIAEPCQDCNRYITCWSLAGNCQQTDDGISCNGSTPRHCRCPDQLGF